MHRMIWSVLLISMLALAACGGNSGRQPAAVPPAAGEAAPTDASAEEVSAAEVEAAAVTDENGDIALPAVDPLTVEGDIVSAGSSTVFPLAEAVAEQFNDEGYAGAVTIDSIGSGAGFSRFCEAGETDIANASRPIKDSERESCAAIGRNPIEFRVGTDALAVVTNQGNVWATDVTTDELAALFTAEKWSDVDPGWPAEKILRYIPGTDSGTFDYFVEEVFDKDPEPILSTSNTQLSEDDNVLVIGVEGSPYAVGFFGYAYYSENADKLNILNIEGVEPNFDSVENATYPLARPLFIYSDATIMAEKPQIAAYVNYFLSHVNDVIEDVGYFPASTEALNQSKTHWLEAMDR